MLKLSLKPLFWPFSFHIIVKKIISKSKKVKFVTLNPFLLANKLLSNDTSRIVTKEKKERKFLNTKAEKRFLLLQLNIDFVCFLYYHYYTIFCKTRISVGKRARFLEVVRQLLPPYYITSWKKKFEKIRIVLREKKRKWKPFWKGFT